MKSRQILGPDGVDTILNPALIDQEKLAKAVAFIKANVSKQLYAELKAKHQFNVYRLE